MANARKLGAASCKQEDLGELADIRARLRERREAARGEGRSTAEILAGRGWGGGWGVFRVKKEGKNGKVHEYWHAAWMVEGKTRNVYLGAARRRATRRRWRERGGGRERSLGIGTLRRHTSDSETPRWCW